MARVLDREDPAMTAWTPRHIELDEDFGRDATQPPLLEEIRMIAALVALLCVVILLV